MRRALSLGAGLRTRSLDSATAAQALTIIERNSRAQTQIIDDLLDVSAIVLRKLHIERRPVDLDRVVEDEVDAARPEAEAHRVALRCVAGHGPHVSGDAGRLQQVVRNLLSNALKFTPEGGTVDVAVDTVGRSRRIVVCDTGQGIEPAFLPHVFDRFRQADSSMTRAYGGLGIGLAIVRHIVELHDGVVTAESEGHGATFTVTLPLLVTPAGTSESSTERHRGAEEALPALGGVRVLVVDDEDETRELVATVLVGCGAEVTAAASADQALSALDDVKPHVVVTDLAMPAGDGFELIRSIRSRSYARGGATPAARADRRRRARHCRARARGRLRGARGEAVRADRSGAGRGPPRRAPGRLTRRLVSPPRREAAPRGRGSPARARSARSARAS